MQLWHQDQSGTVLDVLYMVRKETNFRHKVNTPQIGNKILFAWEKKHSIQWESKYGRNRKSQTNKEEFEKVKETKHQT